MSVDFYINSVTLPEMDADARSFSRRCRSENIRSFGELVTSIGGVRVALLWEVVELLPDGHRRDVPATSSLAVAVVQGLAAVGVRPHKDGMDRSAVADIVCPDAVPEVERSVEAVGVEDGYPLFEEGEGQVLLQIVFVHGGLRMSVVRYG